MRRIGFHDMPTEPLGRWLQLWRDFLLGELEYLIDNPNTTRCGAAADEEEEKRQLVEAIASSQPHALVLTEDGVRWFQDGRVVIGFLPGHVLRSPDTIYLWDGEAWSVNGDGMHGMPEMSRRIELKVEEALLREALYDKKHGLRVPGRARLRENKP